MSNNQKEVKHRTSARVVLFDDQNRILLFRADDPKRILKDGSKHPPFWFTPGGGNEDGESLEQTAIRELEEETGISKEHVTLGPLIWKASIDLISSDKITHLSNNFFIAHTTKTELSFHGFTEEEKGVITDARWFTLDDLQEHNELIYPSKIRGYLLDFLENKDSSYPIKIIEY